MGTKFNITTKAERNYYPPGTDRRFGHVDGMDCPCGPYEAELEHTWLYNRDKDRTGLIISMTITHRPIIPVAESVEDRRPIVFADEKLPVGSDDLVTTMRKAKSRMQQRPTGS